MNLGIGVDLMVTVRKLGGVAQREVSHKGRTSFYGVHTDCDVVIDPKIEFTFPINEQLGARPRFNIKKTGR